MGIIPETHEVVSLDVLYKLASLKSAYFIGYGWLFGMSVWVSFIGGFIALKALPRHQFGTLQHNTFPVYFKLSIGLAGGLLGLWSHLHPVVQTRYLEPALIEVAQAYLLAFVIVAQSLNQFIVGPLTSKVMYQRQKLEKEEGKEYTNPSASPELKALTKKFGALHGISALANLGAVLTLLAHGLWIGNAGI